MTKRELLHVETAHLTGRDAEAVDWLLGEAIILARETPGVTEQALETKLLTLFEAPRWVRALVAKAALETVAAKPTDPAGVALAA